MLIYKLVALESAIIITFLFFTFSHVPFQKTCQRHKFSVISISDRYFRADGLKYHQEQLINHNYFCDFALRI